MFYTWQSGSTYQKNDQNQVGEKGGEINNLSTRLDA